MNYNYPYQPIYQQPYQQAYQQSYQQQIQNLQNQIPQIQQQMSQPMQNGGTFYFVNSQKEVEEWVVGAGQTVFFFDRNNSIFYIKTVAQNGLSQPVEVYEYAQRIDEPEGAIAEANDVVDKYITRDEFEALKAELEAMKGAEG